MTAPASIAELVEAEGGRVTFARFMEAALTHPTLGYYSQADRLLWHGGDFSTAPALSPFFNRTLGRLVTELVDAALTAAPAAGAGRAGPGLPQEGRSPAAADAAKDRARRAGAPVAVVELGGGEGQLAAAVLGSWERERPDLRRRIAYRVVEVGARLQARQASAVAPAAAAGWDVGWGRTLEEACDGVGAVVVVGNEFLDALPVHLVRVAAGALSEAYVEAEPPGLRQTWGPLSEEAAAEAGFLFGALDPPRLEALSGDGIIEVSPGLGDLVRRAARVMPSGSLVNVDYGAWFPGMAQADERPGVEGPTVRRRTVRGYFKHQMVLDPLARPGRQDLTADVDFAALDLHGRRHGFETVLFTTLAAFLRGGGVEDELQALRRRRASRAPCADVLEADRQATVIENLLDGADLGGAFKLMVQVRD